MKHIKYLIAITLLTFLLSNEAEAQQDPVFTQYFFNPLIVNSAYAGQRQALDVTLLVREQWVGIEGRPQTQTLTLHSPLAKNSLAVGGSLIRDKIGATTSTSIFGDFAYRMKVTKKSKLAFGIKGGVNLLSVALSDLENVNQQDLIFSNNLTNKPLLNFGASAFWWSKYHFLGISAPKILQNRFDRSLESMSGSETTHLYVMGGYVFKLNPFLKFKPTFMTRIVENSPVSVDLTANFLFDEKLWLGAMYRLGDSAGILASYQLTDQMRFGYSFDYTLTDIQQVTTFNTHEFMINYEFTYKDRNFVSPRYF